MTSEACVLVTGVSGGSVGHQILHALARSTDKYKIVATDVDPFSYGLYETAHHYLVPRATSPDYIPAVLRLIERENVDIILPGSESEIRALAQATDALKRAGCSLVASPASVLDITRDKWVLQAWLENNGFDVPHTVSGSNWSKFEKQIKYPVVAKPAAKSGGSKGVAILGDRTEVLRYLSESGLAPEEVIFQEYVGDVDSEYTVGVLVSQQRTIIDSIVIHRKLTGLSLGPSREIDGRHYGISTGISQGFVETNKRLQQCCEDLALRIGALGPLNVQCRIADGKIKIFEVHPRFSGTSSIRADVGFNEAEVMVRHYVFGQAFGRLNYRTDVAVIRAFHAVVVPRAVVDAVPMA